MPRSDLRFRVPAEPQVSLVACTSSSAHILYLLPQQRPFPHPTAAVGGGGGMRKGPYRYPYLSRFICTARLLAFLMGLSRPMRKTPTPPSTAKQSQLPPQRQLLHIPPVGGMQSPASGPAPVPAWWPGHYMMSGTSRYGASIFDLRLNYITCPLLPWPVPGQDLRCFRGLHRKAASTFDLILNYKAAGTLRPWAW